MDQNLKQIEKGIFKSTRNRIIAVILIALTVFAIIGGLIYWSIASSRVYVENSSVEAPIINLSTTTGGTLQEVFANVGDNVQNSTPIARVGNELIKSKSSGQILSLDTNIGDNFTPGKTVVTMINPSDLRIVGQVQEDKGLKDIKIGQTAIFTIDAFGSKQYSGIVDEISPTSNSGDIVFNISGSRQEQNFDVKVRFDVTQYPELKNGMSAKLWIYK